MSKPHDAPESNMPNHPICTIIGSAVSAILVVAFARMDGVIGHRLLLSIALGLGFAIPVIAYWKWELRRHRYLWASGDARRSEFAWLPWVAVYLVFVFTAARLHLSPPVGLYSGLTLTFLLYPAQKAIWLAAKERAAEIGNADDTATEIEGK